MGFLENKFSKVVLSSIATFSLFAIIQGCGGGTSSKSCCQNGALEDKVKQTEKVVAVPEVKGEQIVYIDRNVTIIEYVDRNVTVIQYVDRNVTVDKIKVRPEAAIIGLTDGAILQANSTLAIDGIQSTDSDGNVTKYQWMLDDANISTEQNPSLTLPTAPGTHMLCLTVTDNDNLVSTNTCKSFTIPTPDVNPTAAITGLNDKTVKTKCPVTISGATSLGKDANITSYVWTIDDNATTQTGKDLTLSFATLGEHKVCLEVTDTNNNKNESCNTVNVQDHEAPTAVMTVFDTANNSQVMTKDSLMKRLGRYDFSCEGSHDDCNSTVPVSCEWNAHSYLIDANGKKVDYVKDCFDIDNNPNGHKGHGPHIANNSWLVLCSTNINSYKYVEIELKITDQFGKTATRTDVFEVAP